MRKIFMIAVLTALVACKESKKDKEEATTSAVITVAASAKTGVSNGGTVTVQGGTTADGSKVEVITVNDDKKPSFVHWKGSKPMGFHHGNIKFKAGSLAVTDGNVVSGKFVADMTTINCLDLSAGDGKENLENHLKSGDFFDVANFPTATFEVTSSVLKEGKLHITGNLTLKAVTKSITFTATIVKEDGHSTLKSDTFEIDRTDFGITYKSKTINAALKDKFIYDLMEVSFEYHY